MNGRSRLFPRFHDLLRDHCGTNTTLSLWPASSENAIARVGVRHPRRLIKTGLGSPRPGRSFRRVEGEAALCHNEVTVDFTGAARRAGPECIGLTPTDLADFGSNERDFPSREDPGSAQCANNIGWEYVLGADADHDVGIWSKHLAERSPHIGDEPPVCIARRVTVISRHNVPLWIWRSAEKPKPQPLVFLKAGHVKVWGGCNNTLNRASQRQQARELPHVCIEDYGASSWRL